MLAIAKDGRNAAATSKTVPTLSEVLEALSRRDSKYRAARFRIDYKRSVGDMADRKEPRVEYDTLLTQWSFFREDARAEENGKVLCMRYRNANERASLNDIRLYEAAEGKPLTPDKTDKMRYLAHNEAHGIENTLGPIVWGAHPWTVNRWREMERYGKLVIKWETVAGVECVVLVKDGRTITLAPQYDWAPVQYDEAIATGYKQYGEYWLPEKVGLISKPLHDFQGNFFTYAEAVEIRSVKFGEEAGFQFKFDQPSLFDPPPPSIGMKVSVPYSRWRPQWETKTWGSPDDLGTRNIGDFLWSDALDPRDARIWLISTFWRHKEKVRQALGPARSPGRIEYDGAGVPMPFLSGDGAKILWAVFDKATPRLIKIDELAGNARITTAGASFEAGFLPNKETIATSEALTAEFYVRNTGAAPLYLETGGDGRSVRSYRFQFFAFDAEGIPARDPNPDPRHFGGLMGRPPDILPGKAYAEKIDLSRWLVFERPGDYTVVGMRQLQFTEKDTFDSNYRFVYPLRVRFQVHVAAK
ncbi:MAG: hypothetical protein NTX50_26315 [Candidatus Sumerlaeota bacterium]|nr:hypothetical protein [Candidatus Sumerlaeota bacterium]